MKAIWLGDSNPVELICEKTYEVLSIELDGQMLNVIDETNDNFMYPAEGYEVVED